MPDLAIAELIKRSRSLTRDDLLALGEDELTKLSADLAQIEYDRLEAKCAADPLYWAQNFTATENPHWQEQGLPFTAPFPKKAYFVPLFEAFKKYPRLFLPKSREMLSSWCCMVYAMHRAQWGKAEVVVQTSKEEKATRLVEYAAVLFRNQPEWLKQRHPLKRSTTLSMEWNDGGKLFGIPSGETQIRMFHPTIVIFDEAAFLPGFQECYDATEPVAKQIIAISSAAPGFFADQCSR